MKPLVSIKPLSEVSTSCFKLTDCTYAADVQTHVHQDRIPRISIVLQGQLHERVGQCEEWASPLSMVIKPTSARHADRFGPKGARLLSILPDSRCWSNMCERPLLHRWHWFHGHTHAAIVTRFLHDLSTAQQVDEREEALINLIADLEEPEQQFTDGDRPSWLANIAARLRDCCEEDLRIQQLAAEIDLHPVYLARAFRRHFGCSPKQYQHAFRLRRAIHQLTEQMPLVQVALDNGYADQSHFSRQLKDRVGVSPGQMRRLLQAW